MEPDAALKCKATHRHLYVEGLARVDYAIDQMHESAHTHTVDRPQRLT
jgi:hypothetical protein